MQVLEAIFFPDGERFVPGDLARGPWSPEAQHGGPAAALLARSIARFDGGERMFVVRLTVEFLRPIPIAPLQIQTRLVRPGRKVQLVEASLRTEANEVARAAAMRIRCAEVPLPANLERGPEPPPQPESGAAPVSPWRAEWPYVAFHTHAVDHRFVVGRFDTPGPATDWIRLRVPLVAGEETLPLCRVAAAADFGNGVSWILPRRDGYLFINPDLTIYLHRVPAGEWVCLEAVTRVQPHGVGLAESRLWDEKGEIGRSLQGLLIERQ
jgi:hypothetical protein